MKRITNLLFLTIALISTACTKSFEQNDFYSNQEKCLKGVIDIVNSKTALSPATGGYNLNWEKGDRISVYDGKRELFYKAVYGGSTETTFVPLNPIIPSQLEQMIVENVSAKSFVSNDVGNSKSDPKASTDRVLAYYPISIVKHILPIIQNYVENNVNEMPMVAEYIDEETTLHFKPICGILKLDITTSVPDVRVKAVNISANQGLSGNFSLIDGNAIVYGNEGVTLDCGEEGVAIGETATAFNIVLPVNTYSGMTIRILTTEDKMSTFEIQGDKRYTVNPAELRTLNVNATDFTEEQTWTQKNARLMEGSDFCECLKRLSGSISSSSQTSSTSDSRIKKIIFKTGDLSVSPVQVNSFDSEIPVFAEFDKVSGIVTVKTAADKIISHKNSSYMFYSMVQLQEIIGLHKLDVSEVVDFTYMFYGCSALKTLHLESMDISRLTNSGSMNYSFAGLNSLEKLYLGEKGYNKISFKPSSMWCTASSLRTGSISNSITIYCSEAGATWLANTNLRWIHSGYSGKTPVTVKFYDWQDNTKEYTPVWAAD